MSASDISQFQETQNNANLHPQNPAASALRELIMGFRTTQLISVAAKLNLAAHLNAGPKTSEQLSEIIHTNAPALHRLLRALSTLGIFEEKDDGSFSNTPFAALLLDTTAGSLRSLAVLYGEDWLWQAYGRLSYSVESGKPAFEHVHGQSLYEFLQQHPTAASSFHKAMGGYSDMESASVIDAYNFSTADMIVDVGGGHGTFISALLTANPHLSGIVFDLPAVIEDRTDKSAAIKAQKISYAGGDFFNTVPDGGDIYLLKSVLHNWKDSACVQILRNCRKVMSNTAKLLIIERVIPTGSEKSEAKLFDINMLVVTGGQERTVEEYKKLFYAAGFRLARIVPTQSPVSIIEGLPIAEGWVLP